jgi:hypothetical protein
VRADEVQINEEENDMAILADQNSNKKKGSAPKTVAKGTEKGAIAKGEKTPGKAKASKQK